MNEIKRTCPNCGEDCCICPWADYFLESIADESRPPKGPDEE